MKKFRILIIGILISGIFACAGNQQSESNEKDSTTKKTSVNQMDQSIDIVQVADIGCALCQMGLPCKEHKLAAKIADNVYYVEGAALEKLAEYDYCSVIKKATLKGHFKDSIFVAQNIELAQK